MRGVVEHLDLVLRCPTPYDLSRLAAQFLAPPALLAREVAALEIDDESIVPGSGRQLAPSLAANARYADTFVFQLDSWGGRRHGSSISVVDRRCKHALVVARNTHLARQRFAFPIAFAAESLRAHNLWL